MERVEGKGFLDMIASDAYTETRLGISTLSIA